MAFPQTSYARTYDKAASGQLGDTGPHRVESFTNDEGTDIPAGIAVVQKAEGTCDEYDNSSDVVLGVTVLSYAKDPSGLSGEDAIEDGAVCGVLTEGAIWVQVETTIAVTDAVYVRHTAEAPDLQLGRFRNDADTNKAAVLKGARWLSSGTAGGCALLYYSRAAQGMA